MLQQSGEIQFAAYLSAEDGVKHLYPFKLLLFDKKHDLALCRIHYVPGHFEFGAPRMKALPLARSSTATPGTLVVSSGFPLTLSKATLHFGPVTSLSSPDDMLELSLMVNEGESGAPVLRLDSGEIIGAIVLVRTAAVYSGTAAAEQNSGISLAGRVEWMRDLMAQVSPATTESR
ncbi:MAG: serine protease [Acidobacteria bacterium]|nr:serine protease [Acidobacteriota bacterium]